MHNKVGLGDYARGKALCRLRVACSFGRAGHVLAALLAFWRDAARSTSRRTAASEDARLHVPVRGGLAHGRRVLAQEVAQICLGAGRAAATRSDFQRTPARECGAHALLVEESLTVEERKKRQKELDERHDRASP